ARIYPWGNDFECHRLNIKVSDESANTTTPIGIFPSGGSPYGVEDCAGQVWEWCSTQTTSDFELKDYPYQPQDEWNVHMLEGTVGRLRRGGSWSDRSEEVARCAYREWFYPEFRAFDRGFRIVVGSR